MNNYESHSDNAERWSEGLDFDAEWTEDYQLEHAEEITDVLLSMEDEERRRPEMEHDATLRANRIHEEIVFNKGERYQKMVGDISEVLDSDGVSLDIADNVDLKKMEYPFDYLLSKCMRFDFESKEAICQAVMDGIFDELKLAEEKRPVLMLVVSINGRVSKHGNSTSDRDNKGELGHFKEPGAQFRHVDPRAKENGIVRINLPNFDDNPDIRKILATLEHECFHAYQFNCRRNNMPLNTVRDRVMQAAYTAGHNQYISSKNDYGGYYSQGYESSAREFSTQLMRATDILMTEAIMRAMKGENDG